MTARTGCEPGARPRRTALGRVAAVAVLAVAAAGCEDLLLDPPTESRGTGIYDELWTAFDQRYAPFDQRGIDWDEAFARHRPADGADDADAFTAATEMLAELDDGHVTLVAPGRPFFNAQRTFREDTWRDHLDLGVIYDRMEGGAHASGSTVYGVLPGNVGYLRPRDWGEPIQGLDVVMRFLAGRSAVIVDLRHNPGGDFLNGFMLARRFADRRRMAFRTLTRTGPGHGDLGQAVEWHVEPAGTERFAGPVVVLVNGFTNSAAERTAMAFMALPHVTVVGSRTAGNHGEKVGGALSNGWRYSLVPQVVYAADGVSYEGVGLPPDVEVSNDPDEIADGLDRQLEAALELLGGG